MAKQISGKPIRKVTAGALGGAATTIVLFVLKSAWDINVPPDVASALTVMLTFAVSYQTSAADDDLVHLDASVQRAA